MRGPSKTTGTGGSFFNSQGRERKRQVKGQGVDEYYWDTPHHPDAAPAIRGEIAYCGRCHAIYRPKHWLLDQAEYERLAADPTIEQIVCPGCRMLEQEDYHGEVHLRITGLETSRDQILATVYNEEARARQVNPHARIGRVIDRGDEIEVDTLNPSLAHRLAGVLKHAFHGTHTASDFAPRQPYARVYWGKEVPKGK